MLSAMSSASSALSSLSLSLAASAHDVANVLTTDFQGTRSSFEAGRMGGVSVRLVRDTTAAPPEIDAWGAETGHDLSNSDLESETLTRVVTSRAYEANLQVLGAAQEREETLLDLLGR